MTLICDKTKESDINDCLDEALDENQTIQALEANANAIQSTIIALDTSYTDENGVTQSYKNADDYNLAREEAINKIDEYWNYAHGDYLVALCDCKIHPEYDSLSLFASELLQDYKENYLLNREYNQDDFEILLDSALTEVQKLKKTYDAALKILEEYEATAKEAVETANSFELFRHDVTSTSPVIENPPEDNNEELNIEDDSYEKNMDRLVTPGWTANIINSAKTLYIAGEEFSMKGLVVEVYSPEGTLDRSYNYDDESYRFNFSEIDISQKGEYELPVYLSCGTGYTIIKIVLKIKVILESDAYIITYTGKNTVFSAESVKNNYVHIRVPESLGELDILDYYELKKSVLNAQPAKLVTEDIPKSVVYSLNIPDKESKLWWFASDANPQYVHQDTAYFYKREESYQNAKYSQIDIIVEYFLDFSRRLNLENTLYQFEENNEFSPHWFMFDLHGNDAYYINQDEDSGALAVVEFIPDINFVVAESNKFHYYNYSIQVEENRTLSLAGNVELYYDLPYENNQGDIHYHPDFKPLFWLKDGAAINVKDWSNMTLSSIGVKFDYDLYSDFELLGFAPLSLQNSELPYISIAYVYLDRWMYDEDFYYKKEVTGYIDEWGQKIYHVCINETPFGKMIQRYFEADSLEKCSIKDLFNSQCEYDGNISLSDPCMYIGNEVNPDCPKLPCRLFSWYYQRGINCFSNVCITDDGTVPDLPSSSEADSTSHSSYMTYRNVRFEIDISKYNFVNVSLNGVSDIAGTQSGTLTLPNLGGRVIVRDGAIPGENSSILLHGADQVDLSEVSEVDVSKVSTGGNFYGFVNFKNENAATKTNIGATAKTFYGTENRFGGVSAQQIVERANNGEYLNSGISKLSPKKVAPTKSELLPAILDEIV